MLDSSITCSIAHIAEPEKMRVVLYTHQKLVHAPLCAILAPLEEKIAFLEKRIKNLENGKP